MESKEAVSWTRVACQVPFFFERLFMLCAHCAGLYANNYANLVLGLFHKLPVFFPWKGSSLLSMASIR